MIFVDTSAIYALLNRSDENHQKAAACWLRMLDANTPLVTTNYVLVESCALAQNRLGMDAVRSIRDDFLPLLEMVWVDDVIHAHAMTAVLAARRRKLSLVDCVSFAVMRKLGASHAFAFDRHFEEEGFSFPG